MDSATIGIIFSGITGILIALTGIQDRRQRRAVQQMRQWAKRVRLLERVTVAAIDHIHDLEMLLATNGHRAPKRPRLLDHYARLIPRLDGEDGEDDEKLGA